MNTEKYHAIMEFYRNNKPISKTIVREIGRYTAAAGEKGAAAAAGLEIAWYFQPDKVRVFFPENKTVYFLRIYYTPHYMNKAAEKAGRVTSYTPNYELYKKKVLA